MMRSTIIETIYLALIRALHGLFCIYPIEEHKLNEQDHSRPVRGNTSLIIRRSLISGAGLGCFADRDYYKGEVVGEYTGNALSVVQVLRTRDWTFLMGLGKGTNGKRVWVDPKWDLAIKERYINHHFDSSKWNLSLDLRPDERKCVLIANRLIRKDEELYYDYGEKYWRNVTNKPNML